MLCDLHIHSCLSPCGEEEMTPYNIAAMASIKELSLIALTDHNTARNCGATAEAAALFGIGFIPGIEVCTSEEIHVVCLFPGVEAALDMDARIYESLPPVKNRPDIFGRQLLMDSADGILGEEERLLISACGISLTELPDIVRQLGGLVIPSHVMRPSGGVIPVLGTYPPDLEADAYEHDGDDLPSRVLENVPRLKNSDAHRLIDILEPTDALPLPLESATFEGLAKFLREGR